MQSEWYFDVIPIIHDVIYMYAKNLQMTLQKSEMIEKWVSEVSPLLDPMCDLIFSGDF